MKKIVLIGDLISSRKIKKREEAQKNLLKIFNKLNKNEQEIASPLTITLGDEFQAVYAKANPIFNHIWQIILALYPEKIRFSLGVGEINTKINRKQAIGMDGPAFYNARKGLNELKHSPFIFNITADSEIGLIRQSLFLVSHFSYDWKETRLKVLTLMNENTSVNEIAARLQITDKAVYKNIDAGGLNVVKKLLKEISEVLNEHLKK
jgi:hypothetical protein